MLARIVQRFARLTLCDRADRPSTDLSRKSVSIAQSGQRTNGPAKTSEGDPKADIYGEENVPSGEGNTGESVHLPLEISTSQEESFTTTSAAEMPTSVDRESSTAQATNLVITTMGPGSEPSVTSPLWHKAMNLYIARLPEKDKEKILSLNDESTLNQESLNQLLTPLCSKYSQAVSARVLKMISPIVIHVVSFGRVVDVCIQSSPNLGPLIWGALRLALEV